MDKLGDPHLGRVFKTGVPAHRLGDREKQVRMTFEHKVRMANYSSLIIMGDLFDSFSVPEAEVLFAARVLRDAITDGKREQIYILRGNHDASKDAELKSSFDVLMGILEPYSENIHFVTDTLIVGANLLVGWHPFKSAKEQVESVKHLGFYFSRAFGHWDVKQYGGSDHNVIPIAELEELGVHTLYTGHHHHAHTLQNRASQTIVVGSMLPYAHGEQQQGDPLYLTVSYDQFQQEVADDPACYRFSNVRVLLPEGVAFEGPMVDCYSLTFKTVAASGEVEKADYEVTSSATFDPLLLLRETLTAYGVTPARLEALLNRSVELRMGDEA